MIILILIGLLGGLITAVSPCILPVLPVVFLAGGPAPEGPPQPAAAPTSTAAGSSEAGTAVLLDDPPAAKQPRNRRPYAVVAGLVISFSFFTLLGVTIVTALGLPDDILRYIGLGLLVLIGLGLIFPPVERILEKPFARIPQRQVNKEGGAFALGLGLGLLYVPCAGPVLAAITVAGAQGRLSLDIVALTVSFAIGTALPLLAFALAGRRVSERIGAFRRRARKLRIVAGGLMIVLALGLALNVTDAIQRALPDYTSAAQKKIEDSRAARQQLSGLYDDSNKELSRCEDGADQLRSCGQAPPIQGISKWLNTPGGAPVDLKQQHGKVVLIDFWTYSCINCQRSLPHIKEWNRAYKGAGLEIIGVHSPEFGFEKDTGNVQSQAKKLGVTYPVALDNKLTTWNNYRNRFWPAKYLIDSHGTVRYFKFGEGQYAQTEDLIRELLRDANPAVKLPARTAQSDAQLTADRTPETYLNNHNITGYVGDPLLDDKPKNYRLASDIPVNRLSLGGNWTAGYDSFTAGQNARLAMTYKAKNVNLVLSGQGKVTVVRNGKTVKQLDVHGTPTMHRLIDDKEAHEDRLEVRLAPGIQAYVLTFG
ncbi:MULTISPECIES: cytochrome c biogenesis protein CcdA [unclassified Streptomyces]|uniref:redoxin domain-containing protein n=1 Tax=unclassified Streptomyces TaxID=2593676 RepID=UPI0015ECD02A|nr:cytochrome c biogenesis protein CcdA [Streptomyces sp. PsTaAH-137]